MLHEVSEVESTPEKTFVLIILQKMNNDQKKINESTTVTTGETLCSEITRTTHKLLKASHNV
jgi:hypothetical protein